MERFVELPRHPVFQTRMVTNGIETFFRWISSRERPKEPEGVVNAGGLNHKFVGVARGGLPEPNRAGYRIGIGITLVIVAEQVPSAAQAYVPDAIEDNMFCRVCEVHETSVRLAVDKKQQVYGGLRKHAAERLVQFRGAVQLVG